MATTRAFTFSEGTSNKFWTITVDQQSFAVRYGRIGTAGQGLEKSFASDAEAQAAADKLIAEKLGKGYLETAEAGKTAGSAAVDATPAAPQAAPTKAVSRPASTPATAAAGKTAVAPASAAPAAAVPAAKPAATTPAPAGAPVERRIGLDEDDWRYATWRSLPKPRPEAAPFDLAACCAKLRGVRVGSYSSFWHFEDADLPPVMCAQEAVFWFLAMQNIDREATPTKRAAELAAMAIPASLDFKTIKEALALSPQGFGAEALIPLRHLLTAEQLVALLALESASSYWGFRVLGNTLPGIMHAQVVPFLTSQELDAYRAAVRPYITSDEWTRRGQGADNRLFVFAARLGMHEELGALVGAWKDAGAFADHYQDRALDVVLGLGSAGSILRAARLLKLKPRDGDQMRAWLATCEFAGLHEAAEAVLARTDRDEAKALAQVVALIEAPELAPLMLQLRERSRAPAVAREWFERHPAHGVAGLAAVLGTSSALAEPALEWLRLLKKQGGSELIARVAATLAEADAHKLTTWVLAHQEVEYPLVAAGEPAWFAPAAATVKVGKVPGWADPANLPPLVAQRRRLADDQVRTVIQALRDAAAGRTLITALRAGIDALSLDAFAWKLFQAWLADGAPSAQKWAMGAIGRIGGDGCVLRLIPLVRAWPGESQHARAVFGLEILRDIGSDLALMQLNGVAQKLPFKGLKTKAAEFMEVIATEKGLSRAELEDRIVPDCGLDARGQRSFDFGPRQFAFALGPELKPVLRDAAGKVLPNLPKAGGKDDAEKAEAATTEWKLLKKQVADTAAIQSRRLEQAMVTGRRWKSADFQRLLVEHPLMIHLVRLVVWAGFPAGQGRSRLFRITEEREAVDAGDDPVDLASVAEVSIIHPLNLAVEERGAWGQVLSDYGIVPPFLQLGRPIHTPLAGEIDAGWLRRFADMTLPAPALVFGLEKLGWSRGEALDGGGFYEHLKPYTSADCTAIVTYDGTVSMGYIDAAQSLTVKECFLVPGLYSPRSYPEHKVRIPLKDADPVVVSEILVDLLQLAAKVK